MIEVRCSESRADVRRVEMLPGNQACGINKSNAESGQIGFASRGEVISAYTD